MMLDLVIWILGHFHSALIELKMLRTTVRCLTQENEELRNAPKYGDGYEAALTKCLAISKDYTGQGVHIHAEIANVLAKCKRKNE